MDSHTNSNGGLNFTTSFRVSRFAIFPIGSEIVLSKYEELFISGPTSMVISLNSGYLSDRSQIVKLACNFDGRLSTSLESLSAGGKFISNNVLALRNG